MSFHFIFITAHLTEDDLRDVQKAVWDARRKWHNLGLELRIPLSELNTIQDQHKNEFPDCLKAMLIQWLRRSNPPPTWTALAAALRDPILDEEDLAERIETEHHLEVREVSR